MLVATYLFVLQHVQWFAKAVSVSDELLKPLVHEYIRKIRHDIKSAVVSHCLTPIFMTDSRGEIVICNHVDCLACSCGFL